MKTAYPQTNTTCSIRLYSNVPFDNTYKNHTLISSKFKYNSTSIYIPSDTATACERFLNRINPNTLSPYYPRYNLTGDFNFNFSNGLVGSVTLELTPTQTNANYMRLTCGNDVYYYFITGISQVNYDTYTLSLELDVIMTYQDEFLDGMAGVPVFTARKHCHRYNDSGVMPACSDLKTKEETFNGVVPSILKQITPTRFDESTSSSQFSSMSQVLWLYICADAEMITFATDPNDSIDFISKYGDATYPLCMLAIPINVPTIKYYDSNNTLLKTFTSNDVKKCITKLVGSGAFHGAKISHYPPFKKGGIYRADTNTLNIYADSEELVDPLITNLYRIKIGDDTFLIYKSTTGFTGDLGDAFTSGCILIENYKYKHYDLTYSPYGDLKFHHSAPTLLSNRFTDPKLLFSPFTKYFVSSQYSTQGYEFYPELLFSDYVVSADDTFFDLATATTSFIGDNAIYTYIKSYSVAGQGSAFNNYQYGKVGLSGSVNYVIPVGTDALDVFNATQRESFQQSKVASGITSGISIIGGVASIVGGATMVGTGNPMGAGLIAGGISAVAGGIAGEVNTIASSIAKMEDLNNTPDNIAISGSSYISDSNIYTYQSYRELPFIVVYKSNEVITKSADDFFYKYGYKVARECYFNTDLDYTATYQKTDDNLFGRTIFNYIQLNDDITTKINADIPIIVKQKLSSIFNNGITLWNFFGFDELWSLSGSPVNNYYLDKWFMKDTLDNTEYNIIKNNE